MIMKKIHIWLILGFMLADLPQLIRAQSTWTFRVVVAVESQTATYYQQAYGKPIEQIVREQMASINARFSTGSQFNATYNFRVDSIYVITRPIRDEVFGAHPGYQYKIVINGFSDNAIGGGWFGDHQTIYHSWRWEGWGGPFGGYATDGLTHAGYTGRLLRPDKPVVIDITLKLVLMNVFYATIWAIFGSFHNIHSVKGVPKYGVILANDRTEATKC